MEESVKFDPEKAIENMDFQMPKLLELYRLLKKEKIPEHPQLVYLFGQTRENQTSVLDAVKRFIPSGIPVASSGHGMEVSGAASFTEWKGELKKRGVIEKNIIPIPGACVETSEGKQMIHTLSEARALVRYAKEHDLKQIVIVATPWHVPRAFISAVTVARKEYPELKVYALKGADLPWNEAVTGSQGTLKGTRTEFIFAEMARIFIYHLKGDLDTPEQVLEYLTQRDAKPE